MLTVSKKNECLDRRKIPNINMGVSPNPFWHIMFGLFSSGFMIFFWHMWYFSMLPLVLLTVLKRWFWYMYISLYWLQGFKNVTSHFVSCCYVCWLIILALWSIRSGKRHLVYLLVVYLYIHVVVLFLSVPLLGCDLGCELSHQYFRNPLRDLPSFDITQILFLAGIPSVQFLYLLIL